VFEKQIQALREPTAVAAAKPASKPATKPAAKKKSASQ
jgi:hypothetical protein